MATSSKAKSATKKPAPKAAKPPKKAAKKATALWPPEIALLLAPVTKATIEKEARSIIKGFTSVTFALGDLVTDANELLGAKADLPDLVKRRFAVHPNLITRIELLVAPLTPLVILFAEMSAEAKARTESADTSRERLLMIRGDLSSLGATVGLPSEYFRLGVRKTDRINPVVQRLSEVLAIARKHQDKLPDPERVEALLVEGEALVARHLTVRVERAELRGQGSGAVSLAEGYKRLLWDAMQHLSRVGLAAYEGDATREKRYRLDNVYADRPTPAKPKPT